MPFHHGRAGAAVGDHRTAPPARPSVGDQAQRLAAGSALGQPARFRVATSRAAALHREAPVVGKISTWWLRVGNSTNGPWELVVQADQARYRRPRRDLLQAALGSASN